MLGSGQASFVANTSLDQGADQHSAGAVVWSMLAAGPTFLAGLVGAPWGFRDYNSLLGWFDVPMPPGVWMPNLLIVGMFGAAGLAWMPWRKALSLGILVVFAFVVPLRSLIQLHVLAGEVFSPRYWALLAVAAFGLLLIAKPGRRIELTAWQWWLTWVAMVYVAAVALHEYLRRYVTGIDVVAIDLSKDAEWWPWTWVSPNIVWAIGTLAWAVFAFIALRHVRASAAHAQPGQRSELREATTAA